MASGKKDKAKAAEAAPAKINEAKKNAGAAAEAPDMNEKPAAGFPVVDIGASAGGLAAFEAFLSGPWPRTSASGPSASYFREPAATAPWVFGP